MPRLVRCLLSVLVLAVCLKGQSAPGITAEWDIRAVLKEIAAHAGRLVPMLDKSNPAAWVQKGASDTYVAQWKSARAQAQALAGDATELAQNPEKLPAALKCFFRMQSLEFTLGSLQDGMRRYESPAAASSLASLASE